MRRYPFKMKGISTYETGFLPVYDTDSRVLILGSFPSVKSREIQFYYGHKQNRFWGMLCGYFSQEIPQTVEEKRAFLLRNGVALWDMATACYIDGSADNNVRSAEIADLTEIFQTATIEKILLNGSLAYQLFTQNYAGIAIPYQKMLSTSPANPRYKQETWWNALDSVFKNIRK